MQLYVAPWKGKARRLTPIALKGYLAKPQWSPDGNRLALLYTKDLARSHYLADFDLDRLGTQMRQTAKALGLDQADQRIAVTDAGQGIEADLVGHILKLHPTEVLEQSGAVAADLFLVLRPS